MGQRWGTQSNPPAPSAPLGAGSPLARGALGERWSSSALAEGACFPMVPLAGARAWLRFTSSCTSR